MRLVIKIVSILCLLLSLQLRAATNNCATCEVWEVGAAITNAASGDVIEIPEGVCEWTNGVFAVNKALTIIGAGDGVALSGSGSNMTYSVTGAATVIVDQQVSRSRPLITAIHTNKNALFRITQLQIAGGTNTGNNVTGQIQIKTTSDVTNGPPFRFDHIFMTNVYGRHFYLYAYANGVIDTCVFVGGQATAFDGRAPDSSNKGHLSWSLPVYVGTTNEGVFIENCYYTNILTSNIRSTTDAFAGGRLIVRYVNAYGMAVENHGTESTGEFRGGRWIASYGNFFTWSGAQGENATLYRSGTGVVFSNTVMGNYPGLVRFYNHRYESTYSPWGTATGTNAWDTNWNNGEVLVSGTHTGTNSSYAYLVDTNKNWTTNQLQGYTVTVAGSTNVSIVLYNSTTTATLLGSTFTYNRVYFTNGQNYEMRLVWKAIDQPGAGAGDLLTGGNAQSNISSTNTVTGYPTATNMTYGYPNTDDPIYVWNNAGVTNVNTIPRIVENRDFIIGTARPGYAILEYPHPLRGEGGGGGSPTPRTARATTARVKNLRVNP